MNIMELGAIGELVGGVAVTATLLYLTAQIRQNTRQMRGDAYIAVNALAGARKRGRDREVGADEAALSLSQPRRIT